MEFEKLTPNGVEISAVDMHGKTVEKFIPFCSRIPNFIELKDGTLVYIFNVKYDSQLDEAKGCTALMRSRDGGKNWGEMRLLTYDGVSEDIYPATYIYDEINDAIVLFSRSRHWKPEFERDKVIAEVDQARGYTYERFWVAKSFDGGLTFTDYKEVKIEGTPENWTIQHAATPGIGIQLKHQADAAKNGRLIIPANRAELNDGVNEFRAHLIYSDDFGDSWKVGALQDYLGANESVVVELNDGTIVHNCRNQGGTPWNLRIQGFSRDGGETLEDSSAVETLYDPICHAGFVSAMVDGKEYIFFSSPSGPLYGVPGRTFGFGTMQQCGIRESMKIYVSADGGHTYKAVKQVSESGVLAAYSALCATSEGKLLIAWESGPELNQYREINYTSFDIKELVRLYEEESSLK